MTSRPMFPTPKTASWRPGSREGRKICWHDLIRSGHRQNGWTASTDWNELKWMFVEGVLVYWGDAWNAPNTNQKIKISQETKMKGNPFFSETLTTPSVRKKTFHFSLQPRSRTSLWGPWQIPNVAILPVSGIPPLHNPKQHDWHELKMKLAKICIYMCFFHASCGL